MQPLRPPFYALLAVPYDPHFSIFQFFKILLFNKNHKCFQICHSKVSPRVFRHFTHKASVTSVNAEANVHRADWLMSVFVNELAPPHVPSQRGQCVRLCRRIMIYTLEPKFTQNFHSKASNFAKIQLSPIFQFFNKPYFFQKNQFKSLFLVPTHSLSPHLWPEGPHIYTKIKVE